MDDGAPPPPADRLAERLRGFGPIGLLSFVIILLADNPGLPLGALLVLAWARLSHTPLSALGFTRPKRWLGTVLLGLAFGVALKCAMKAIVMPMLGADPVNHAYHYLAHNRAAIPGFLYAIVVGA